MVLRKNMLTTYALYTGYNHHKKSIHRVHILGTTWKDECKAYIKDVWKPVFSNV